MGRMAALDEQNSQAPAGPASDRRAEKAEPLYGNREGDPKLPLEEERSRPSFLIAAFLAILGVLGLFLLGVLIR